MDLGNQGYTYSLESNQQVSCHGCGYLRWLALHSPADAVKAGEAARKSDRKRGGRDIEALAPTFSSGAGEG